MQLKCDGIKIYGFNYISHQPLACSNSPDFHINHCSKTFTPLQLTWLDFDFYLTPTPLCCMYVCACIQCICFCGYLSWIMHQPFTAYFYPHGIAVFVGSHSISGAHHSTLRRAFRAVMFQRTALFSSLPQTPTSTSLLISLPSSDGMKWRDK